MDKEKNKLVISEWVADEAQRKVLAYEANNFFKPNKTKELKSIMHDVDLDVITNFSSQMEYFLWLSKTTDWFHDAILPFYRQEVKESNNDLRSITSRFLYEYVSCQIVLINLNPEFFDEELLFNSIIQGQFFDISFDVDIPKILDA